MEPIKFEIERQLGSGTFGVANLCRIAGTNERVVIKEQTLTADKGGRLAHQIHFEAQVMESLCHRNIVRFVDSWWDGDKFSIAMEYCNYGDLRQAIRHRRNKCDQGFDEAQIRQWIAEIASALHYCHVQHILHRDLKAENVFITNKNGVLSMKVADFGFARTLQDTTAFAHSRLGTPASLAPEIGEGSPYNNRVDMWSLGVILYELMTLRRPFTGMTVREVLDSISTDEPESARALSNGMYSTDLYNLCDALLTKDPKLRPAARDVLSLPWLCSPSIDAVAPALLAQREQEAWNRISYRATLAQSTLHIHVGEFKVNIRKAPDTQSAILGVVHRGDVIEEVGRQQPVAGGPVWYQLVQGYCIRHDPSGHRIFREIPNWRVQRPGSVWDDSVPTASISTSDDGDKKATDVLAKRFDSRETRLRMLLQFLGDQDLPESLVGELIESYDELRASVVDDSNWTYFCVKALRQLKAVHCIRVLRVAIRFMDKPK